ncbi:hypothetical protein AUC43_15190 [Hymenobacter sedentarius]|uniref:Uncharacterized protein n=1 Tax=Hymenobacter sedentarius TaxID=1411621 RepID=A0A0U3SJK8_9BACT|nr:hypothetical protein [Hymenobacter sedentarius]ALW86308.1 hypothetical protein AUC43_15190 [Hymenobacter sedentarius]
MAKSETDNSSPRLTKVNPTVRAIPERSVAKREVNYTSVSISKTALPKIAQLKEIALKEMQPALSTQMVMDFAVEMAMRHQDELVAYARRNTVDPRVAQFLRLQEELAAAGLLPEQK